MNQYEEAQMGITHRLTELVVAKSRGVFLWTVLAVQRLVAGLQNRDPIQIIEAQLDEVPVDLEQLFASLLATTHPSNRGIGSRFLQVALRNFEMGAEPNLLQLSYCEDGQY